MKALFALMQKDLLLELRRKDTLVSVFFFAFLILLLFSFAFAPGQMTRVQREALAPGILWIAFVFAGVTGMTLTFDKERLNQSLDGLLMTPVPISLVYVSKLLSNLLFLSLVQVALVPVCVVMFNLEVHARMGLVVFPIVLGTLGYLTTGTLFSAVTMRLQMRGLLLPILNFPLTIPSLIPAVESTSKLIGVWQGDVFWNMVMFLVGVNAVQLPIALVLFPSVVREV